MTDKLIEVARKVLNADSRTKAASRAPAKQFYALGEDLYYGIPMTPQRRADLDAQALRQGIKGRYGALPMEKGIPDAAGVASRLNAILVPAIGARQRSLAATAQTDLLAAAAELTAHAKK